MENNKQAFASEFGQRSRFTTAFPTTLTPAQFVDKLFANAGVTPSPTDRNAAISEFGATNTADTAAKARALRRVAYSGYDFWLTKLNQFNGNFVSAEMVKAFITSSEYRQRFGP